MDEPEFEIVEHHVSLPFRSRGQHRDYEVYHSRHLDVWVAPKTMTNVRWYAHIADPDETGGLLTGRVLRDDDGVYVIVTGAVRAGDAAGGRGHFTLSAEQTTDLRLEAARRDPGADVIGWWHSHLEWSGYSGVDAKTQSMWTSPHHVGLLVFARGRSWVQAYLGPDSVLMSPRDRASPKTAPGPPSPFVRSSSPVARPPSSVVRHPNASRSSSLTVPRIFSHRAGPSAGAERPREAPGPPPPGSPPRWRPLLALLALGLLAVLLLMVLSALRDGGRDRTVAWSCVAANAQAVCHAQTSEPGEIQWYLAERQVGVGPDVSFALLSDREAVSVVVRSGETELAGGEQWLTYDGLVEPQPTRGKGTRSDPAGLGP
ncbi:Mov34/MPN/PAD-1 family protein [Sphaerisporangium corydalis]|uniref:Mov34/MPN/PAD-1 family protein n=1 Tax=Sphaerisporangium corydalis TaxID=1441875 RepID=A0ABV9EFA1_9ACTN|nr:Mov34/MPN/PAD-1 family protein [Sphaerisporangium corydalis]